VDGNFPPPPAETAPANDTTMHTPHSSDGQAGTEWKDSRPPWVKPPVPFITISRECCSGGSTLAQMLARKLSGATVGAAWTIFGGNLINQMLQTHHLPTDLARFLPEDRVPEVSATIGEIVGRHPSLWDLVQKANHTMRQLAREGQVIFVGRGANFCTADVPGGVHVRLVAPASYRAKYYAHRFNLPLDQAAKHNEKCDAARRRYVSTHFNADVADPSAYDLVINTAHVPLEEAAEMIIAHLRAQLGAAA
jgi:cytidylate kinase